MQARVLQGTASGVVPPAGGVQASRSHRTPSSGIYEEKEVLPMSAYEIVMVVIASVTLVLALIKHNDR